MLYLLPWVFWDSWPSFPLFNYCCFGFLVSLQCLRKPLRSLWQGPSGCASVREACEFSHQLLVFIDRRLDAVETCTQILPNSNQCQSVTSYDYRTFGWSTPHVFLYKHNPTFSIAFTFALGKSGTFIALSWDGEGFFKSFFTLTAPDGWKQSWYNQPGWNLKWFLRCFDDPFSSFSFFNLSFVVGSGAAPNNSCSYTLASKLKAESIKLKAFKSGWKIQHVLCCCPWLLHLCNAMH